MLTADYQNGDGETRWQIIPE